MENWREILDLSHPLIRAERKRIEDAMPSIFFLYDLNRGDAHTMGEGTHALRQEEAAPRPCPGNFIEVGHE